MANAGWTLCGLRETMGTVKPMTTIANCFDVNEAMHLRMVLESAGIPTFIPDETMASLAPYHFLSGTGVRLQVAEEHASEAREILANENRAS